MSDPKPIWRARRLAVDHLVTVMRRELSGFISTEASYWGIPNQPDVERIFKTVPGSEEIDGVARNHATRMYVFPDGNLEALDLKTQGAQRGAQWSELDIAVVLLFLNNIQPSRPEDPDSVPLDMGELFQLRSEAYASAIVECCLTYGKSLSPYGDIYPINDIFFERSDAGIFKSDQQHVFGTAEVVFRCKMEVQFPTYSRLPGV